MSEYTPTTEDMENCYVYAGSNPDGSLVAPERVLHAEFTRWLAAHDREVAAKALRDAADKFMPHPELGLARLADAAADLLRAEADRIEKGDVDEPR